MNNKWLRRTEVVKELEITSDGETMHLPIRVGDTIELDVKFKIQTDDTLVEKTKKIKIVVV